MPKVVEVTDHAIADAAARIVSGGVVAFPTETVYGLGADTSNPKAIDAIFAMKGRPANNPLIAHVVDAEQAKSVVADWNEKCEAVAQRFWPGPLTLVVKRALTIPSSATAGLETIAVRCPAHPVARKLLSIVGRPVSAPSANRSGHVSPTTAQHVADDFSDYDDLLILDGGRCDVGIESTVIDMTRCPPRVLRPGGQSIESLRGVLGELETPVLRAQDVSPGTSAKHYAPSKPARIVASEELESQLAAAKQPMAVLCFEPKRVPKPHRTVEMESDPVHYAMNLYAALRTAESMDVQTILIESPPASELWSAVRDRLERATGELT